MLINTTDRKGGLESLIAQHLFEAASTIHEKAHEAKDTALLELFQPDKKVEGPNDNYNSFSAEHTHGDGCGCEIWHFVQHLAMQPKQVMENHPLAAAYLQSSGVQQLLDKAPGAIYNKTLSTYKIEDGASYVGRSCFS